jgi:hypothetical protein
MSTKPWMAAICTAPKQPESRFVLSAERARIAEALPAAQPTRQPVMLKVFEKEPISIATSRAPSISRIEGAGGSASSA